MKKSRLLGAVCAVVLSLVILPSRAALAPVLGGQAVSDTDFGITWIADANLAASNTFGLATGTSLGTYTGDTSGVDGFINTNGTMNWPGALFWIDAMNADGGTGYLGYSDWRLPTSLNQDGSGPCGPAFSCSDSEMGHLFYDEFGVSAGSSVTTGDATELAKFTNVQSGSYWSGTEYSSSQAWFFNFNGGGQSRNADKDGIHEGDIVTYGWAVRTGVVPVPAAVWLFGSGLIGLIGIARRKRA